MTLIPPFDVQRIFITPWQVNGESYFWIVLMGFLVTLACGLVGQYLVVRRIALVGDAISHSLLPGIVLAFLFTHSRAPVIIALGAVVVGILAALLIAWIHRYSRIKPDAALGIVFSTFFAIGVILITLFADHVDIDAQCVLYGEIGFIPLENPLQIAGVSLPQPILQMVGVVVLILALIVAFYKELLVASFDPGLARSLGISTHAIHYGLMIALAIVIVGAFKAVGVILVVAMLIFPGVTAALLSDRFAVILGLVAGFAALYAVGGVHLAIWLDCSIAAAMVVMAISLFILAWIVKKCRRSC